MRPAGSLGARHAPDLGLWKNREIGLVGYGCEPCCFGIGEVRQRAVFDGVGVGEQLFVGHGATLGRLMRAIRIGRPRTISGFNLRAKNRPRITNRSWSRHSIPLV